MERLNSLLKHTALSALNQRHQQSEAANKIWEAVVPADLVKFCHAVEVKNHQITVLAENNAVAAKIKLLTPSLLIQLKKQECEITAIRVKVQVKSALQNKSKPLRKLSHTAAKQLGDLASKLAGTPLGEALKKISKNAD